MGRGPRRARRREVPEYQWLIDTHGLKAVLESRNNALRVAVFDAIQSGQMRLLRSVRREIEGFDGLLPQFNAILGKRYVDITVTAQSRSAVLMEAYGANPIGGIPQAATFDAIALAMTHGVQLVSSGKSLRRCERIVQRCGAGNVLDVADF